MTSGLAVKAHMYIVEENGYSLVKAQTFKASVVSHVDNFLIENANINRNPFLSTTLIDLDKLFLLRGVLLDDRMKTTERPDISLQLSEQINKNMNAPENIELNKKDFCHLNKFARMLSDEE